MSEHQQPPETPIGDQVGTPDEIDTVERLNDTQIAQLHSLLQQQWWGKARSLQDVQTMVRHSSLVIGLVDHDSRRLLGFCRVLTDFVFRGTVYDVMVEKAWQRRGLGQRVMQTRSEHPKLRQVGCLYLSCNPNMVPFYEAWGFRVFEDGMEWMIKGKRDG